jgi:hypothetical protein
MKTSAIDDLGTRAADIAMRGAVNKLHADRVDVPRDEATIETLLVLIREETCNALSGAMKDAEDAIKAGMGGFASATFGASMTLAGTKAATRWIAARKTAVRS